jgi:peptide/nickel transport system substrate-binding protein
VLLGAVLAQPVRRALQTQWRDARKPVAALTSALLCLVLVLTTLFIARPPSALAIRPTHLGYDFSYTYHQPPPGHTGGAITVGLAEIMESLAPSGLGIGSQGISSAIWQGCVVQLPDLTLGLAGWKADQCTEVPTVDNGGESPDERTTTFTIAPRAVWSDGVPITAADFLFSERLYADANIGGGGFPPWNQMLLSALDAHTLQIHWAAPYTDYLTALSELIPVPLHIYATGNYAGVYDPTTGAYNSTLAQQLMTDPSFNTAIPVDNGPFTIQSFAPESQVVLVKNPRFFSNVFHTPALDRVTLLSPEHDVFTQFGVTADQRIQMDAEVIGQYRRGGLELATPLEPHGLRQLSGIPSGEVSMSPTPTFTTKLGFNERSAAPSAQGNGGVSIFSDRRVRQAFVEAFDRCAAVRAQLLGSIRCGDPNWFTDEADAASPDAIYDPTFALPVYNPTDAAKLLDQAGYRVVAGIRRNKDGTTPLQLKLLVSFGASPDAVIVQRMQQDYTKNLHIGVTVTSHVSFGGGPRSPIETGVFDLFLFIGADSTDPVGRLSSDLGPFDSADIVSPQNPSGGNVFGIIDPQVSQREQLAAQTLSDEQRTAVLRSLQRYFSEQYYVETIYLKAQISLVKPTLCNFKMSPDGFGGNDLWNIADWYVAPTCP